MVAQGLAVIFISHKLDEVLRVSQRIAVLRAGKLIAVLPAAGASKADLAEAMVGRSIAPPVRRRHAAGALVCEVPGTSLKLRAGEIVAIAGVAGNGQQALAARLCGEGGGAVLLEGRALTASPRAFVDAGVARIPEDRHAVGVVGELPLWENAVLERYASPAFARGGVIRRTAARAFAQELLERFDVRGAGIDGSTQALSGGNMQKLILGRELSGGTPKLIVANQPTWGLDIGAVAYVHQQLLDACAAGGAVLLISEDLDEIFAVADQVAVIHQGCIGEARPVARWTLAEIGLAMSGARHAA
jgi:simple sugar transport system ATP-binding protein